MSERFITRDGARLRLFDTGGSGLPVVFQHGLGGSEAQVRQAFPDDAGFRRVTLECRAQGASEPGARRPFSLSMLAQDVLAGADAAGLSRFVAGGISTGAAIALHLARHHRDRVSALILVRPSWTFEAAPPNMRAFVEIAALLRQHPPREARRLFEASPVAALLREEGPDNLNSLLGFFDRPDPRVLADLLGDIATDGPGVSRDEAGLLDRPTLVIGNDLDHVHPPAHARAIAAAIPGAVHVEAASKARNAAAHFADIRAAITRFLNDLPESARSALS